MNDILIHFNNPSAHSVIYDVKANKMKTNMIYRLNLMIKMHAILGQYENCFKIEIMQLLPHKRKSKFIRCKSAQQPPDNEYFIQFYIKKIFEASLREMRRYVNEYT